jgi:carbamate kinase
MTPPREQRGKAPAVVVALGGNALQPRGETGEIHEQFAHTRESMAGIASLAEAGWRVAIVHGNGPQIGDELLRNEVAREERPPLPLGVLVAATAGWIGYMIQQSLQNEFARRGLARQVVTLLTQVVVDPSDPAMRRPSKPIGRVLEPGVAQELARRHGWVVREEEGGWRRVVSSPRPLEIVERDAIRRLLDSDAVVIAAGGGGTPVARHSDGRLEGVDAVIDKDSAAAILACDVHADVLLILTDVEGVYLDWGKPQRSLLRELPVAEARRLIESDTFPAGSMRPKVDAAATFVQQGGGRAIIARLDRGRAAVEGRDGTHIVA